MLFWPKRSLLSVCLCLFYFSFSCRSAPQPVTIVTDDSYPPYPFYHDGELQGMYIELVRAAAEYLKDDYKIEIVAEPWKRALASIENGQAFAILPPYKHTEKRPYIWPYSIPIFNEVVVAFCRNNVDLFTAVTSSLDREHRPINVGINAGFLILNDELERAAAQKRIIVWENKSTHANLVKLLRGRIDCYVNDRRSTLWEMEQLRYTDPSINMSHISENMVVISRAAYIGYTKDGSGRFSYKDDFVKKMNAALNLVLQHKDWSQYK